MLKRAEDYQDLGPHSRGFDSYPEPYDATMEPCGHRNSSLSTNLLKKSSFRPKLFATASSCYCGHIVQARVLLLIMAGAKCLRESIFGQNLFSLLKTKKFDIVISTIRGLIPDSCRPYIILYDHHKKPF